MSVLVWNYHDDDVSAPTADIRMTITGLKDGPATVTHYRVDDTHGNAYTAWLRMGSPQQPTTAQYASLERAGRLPALMPGAKVRIKGGRLEQGFFLPRQGVSLLVITP